MLDLPAIQYESVAAFINARQKELGATDEQIAEHCDLPNERSVKLIRQGLAPMNMYKSYELAMLLESDPADVLGLILKENDPALLALIQKSFGPLHFCEGEVDLINILRDAWTDRNPVPVVLGKDYAIVIVDHIHARSVRDSRVFN
jgi:hypothetical protein